MKSIFSILIFLFSFCSASEKVDGEQIKVVLTSLTSGIATITKWKKISAKAQLIDNQEYWDPTLMKSEGLKLCQAIKEVSEFAKEKQIKDFSKTYFLWKNHQVSIKKNENGEEKNDQ